MATASSESDTRTPRRRRRFPRVRKYTGVTLKVLGLGVALFAILVMGPELTIPFNSGALFALPLVYVCYQIVRDHKRTDTTTKWMLAVPLMATGVSLYATIMLFGYDTMPAFLGWLALFPLFLFMLYAFVMSMLLLGRLSALKARKVRSQEDNDYIFDRTYGGYIYLGAGTLALVVTSKLGFWFGPGIFAAYGNHFEQGSFLAFILGFCLTMRALAMRPDLEYDEDKTPEVTPGTNPAEDTDTDTDNTGGPDNSDDAQRRGYFPLDDEDDEVDNDFYGPPQPANANEHTDRIPRVGEDGHPVDPTHSGTPSS